MSREHSHMQLKPHSHAISSPTPSAPYSLPTSSALANPSSAVFDSNTLPVDELIFTFGGGSFFFSFLYLSNIPSSWHTSSHTETNSVVGQNASMSGSRFELYCMGPQVSRQK
ncbi:hypothetical protein NMG60_11015324 [Bertholletia excelsa]